MTPFAMVLSALVLTLLVGSWYALPGPWARLLVRGAVRAAGLRTRHMTVSGVQWQYLEGGRGPVLILLHGFGAEASHWLMLARGLRRNFRLLIPDLPGFGNSRMPEPFDFSIDVQARRVLDWLDALRVDSFLIGGSSMGGWIAATIAANNPQRVRALWLQDPLGVSLASASEFTQTQVRTGRHPFEIANQRQYRELVRSLFGGRPPPIPWPLRYTSSARFRQLRTMKDRLEHQVTGYRPPLEDLVAQLRMPVLIEWGGRDRAVHPDGARILGDRLPQAEIVVHPGVGHLPMLEAPGQSRRAFQAFCIRHGL